MFCNSCGIALVDIDNLCEDCFEAKTAIEGERAAVARQALVERVIESGDEAAFEFLEDFYGSSRNSNDQQTSPTFGAGSNDNHS